MNFDFDGKISREVLENYLSRSVTMMRLSDSDTLQDDVRMIVDTGARFIGRSALVWRPVADDDEHFHKAEAMVQAVHRQNPQVILQAAIFEAVYETVDGIAVPRWVFEEFGLPVEPRCFCYDRMLFPDGRHKGQWGPTGSVPDIGQLETQMWFYYRARRYIDAGFEALHLGQVHLYGSQDRGYLQTQGLFDRIRGYAREKARRHLVLLDAHTNGIVIDGRSLFDINSWILFPREIKGQPEKARLISQGKSRGGVTPSGWACVSLPYLKEFDNYGGWINNAPPSVRKKKPDGSLYLPPEPVDHPLWPWGRDEISWYANLPREEKASFLAYAQGWLDEQNDGGHLQVPMYRDASLPAKGSQCSDQQYVQLQYRANHAGPGCPDGFGDEEMISNFWSLERRVGQETSEESVAAYLQRGRCYQDSETGFWYPETVVLAGDFQQSLGELLWNPGGCKTRMEFKGDGMYELKLEFPEAGEFAGRVCVGGSWTENYGKGGIADGEDLAVRVPHPGSRLKFTFDYRTRRLEVSHPL